MSTEKSITYLLGQTFNLIRLKLKENFKEINIDMTLEQYVMLNLINLKDDLTQQDLANHFQKDKSLILRHVNTLINDSYVDRKTDDTDKRKKILILTPKGKEVLLLLKNIAGKLSDDLMVGVTEKEKEVFESVIVKIQNNTGQVDLLDTMKVCKK
ncbi:MarR family transcriptional regulator [Maribellus sp. YY47]|uniref:MarR family winged helix-turn-helix transcriptional regulator n=1 Tax=Maribellus sp. YY47 TaxID=2929486 RepID=UPI002001A39B|nr:MarR family transcriptional regulator [Maribellus sp. YY47]MCK3686419.1 MarR family transcriptional regulator [Maribellus sp. YY47]